MANNKKEHKVEREEFWHYEGHLVYIILIIIFSITYPVWDLLPSGEIWGFFSFILFLGLFALVYNILFKWDFKKVRLRKSRTIQKDH
ncbi:MAG: hypothetical protein ACFFCV_17890 [Promethearchaeota archaeon]